MAVDDKHQKLKSQEGKIANAVKVMLESAQHKGENCSPQYIFI
jgi:hypothetical protein